MIKVNFSSAINGVLFCMYIYLAFYILNKSFMSGVVYIAVLGVLALCLVPVLLSFIFPRVKVALPGVYFAIISFAPPSIVFDEPLRLLGANVLPAYLASIVYFFFRLVDGDVRRVPALVFLLAGLFVFFSVVQFPLILMYGFESEVTEIQASSSVLVFLFVFLFVFVIVDLARRLNSNYAFFIILIIFSLQVYQWYVFLMNGGVDDVLWFGGENRWLRYGLGYTGDGFNPARAYAIVWDPNYLISLLMPLFLISVKGKVGVNRLFVDIFFCLAVVMTLSYQSIAIMFMTIFLSRAGVVWVGAARRIAYACVLLLPIGSIFFFFAFAGESLPPPQQASSFERLHIIWGIGHALADYPLGIGIGVFDQLAMSMFFDDAMVRGLPPHGWLFELMVGVGLVGYYIITSYLFLMTRNLDKWGNIGFLGFLFWGVTSPCITTPYFWIFLSVAIIGKIPSHLHPRFDANIVRPNAKKSLGVLTV